MRQDLESGNLIGKGELASFEILKHITHLKPRTLKQFPLYDGIYKQVPIEWIISQEEYDTLSQPHQNGSMDLFIKLGQRRVAIRVQGKNHGEGLKGLGKAQHDKVQKQILQKYCEVVDIHFQECKELFKDRINEKSQKELVTSFLTARVSIPTA